MALLLGSVLLAGAGCVDNGTTFFIRGMKAPTVMGTTCVYSSDPSTAVLTDGILDVSLRPTYTLAPILQSQVFSRGDFTSGRAESSNLVVEGFVVELREDAPTGPLLAQIDPFMYRARSTSMVQTVQSPAFTNPFSVYVTSVVPPGTGGAPGFGVTTVEAIPVAVGQNLFNAVCLQQRALDFTDATDVCPAPSRNLTITKRVMIGISAFGHFAGADGVSVESPKYYFPVTVCCGCLLSFPPIVVSAGGPVTPPSNSQCNVGTAVANAASCATARGQDVDVDCNLCIGSLLCQPSNYSPTNGDCRLRH